MDAPLSVGVVLLGGAPLLWWFAFAKVRDLRRGTLMQAEVTGHLSFMTEGTVKYNARFAVTIDGRTIEGGADANRLSKSPAVGALVPVRYRPGDEVPLQDGSAMAHVGPAIIAILGTVMAGAGVSILTGGNTSWW
jgi:uncharacterized protein DUF3592